MRECLSHCIVSQLRIRLSSCKHTGQLRGVVQHGEIAVHCDNVLLHVSNECCISGVFVGAAIQLGSKDKGAPMLACVVDRDGVTFDGGVGPSLVRHDGELDGG